MGQMRFIVPRPELLPEGAVERAYLAGAEGIPWRCVNTWSVIDPRTQERELLIERSASESGNLYIPWCVEGRGELVLSTASLMERSKPYHLALELARGSVNRLRNQFAEWQCLGLKLTPGLSEELKRATTSLSQAVVASGAAAEQWSHDTIGQAVVAGEKLAESYAEQAIAARRQHTPSLPTFFACRLDARPLAAHETDGYLAALNSAMVAFQWRTIEQEDGILNWDACDRQLHWCQQQGLRIVGGPLLQLDAFHLPDLLVQRPHDLEFVQQRLVRYVRAAVERYRGTVNVWNCAARFNLEASIPLSEEDRLRLVVAVIDEVQRLDPRTPYIVSFDQPWAEYLATCDLDFSPLHFADSLVRADLGIAGIALEINLGYWPEGSLPRDWLEISRQLDRWNMLGLPLLLVVSAPSAASIDPQARVQVRHARCASDGVPSPAFQEQLLNRFATLALAKSFVHGLIWNNLSDAVPHEFAHAGLFGADGKPKPALQRLAALKRQYL